MFTLVTGRYTYVHGYRDIVILVSCCTEYLAPPTVVLTVRHNGRQPKAKLSPITATQNYTLTIPHTKYWIFSSIIFAIIRT